MSLGLHQARTKIRVADPRLDFDEQGIQVISDSATGLIYQKYTAANVNGGIINFNTFQQPTQAISTKMFIKTKFAVVIDSGVNNTVPIYNQAEDAPRQFPLHAVAQNARIQINGASNDIYPNQMIHALMRYNNTVSELGRDLSTCPSFPDLYQTFEDGTAVAQGYFTPTQGYGTGNNSLGAMGVCAFDMEPRGGWPVKLTYSGVGERTLTITFESMEPVFLSPLIWGHDNHKSLFGVSNLNITYNLGDMTRVWCHNNVAHPYTGTTTITASIVSNPELYCVLMQPKMIDKISPVQIYPWNQIAPYQQEFTFPARLANPDPLTAPYDIQQYTGFSFNSIQLTGVPKRIYIYAKRAVETPFTTDTFAAISNLNVQFDTVTGIFGGAPPEQLYQVCAENGYNGSFMDWAYYSGSVMCIDCEKDLPIAELLAVGSGKNITFSFKCDLGRLSNARGANPEERYKLYTMIVYEGIFSIDQLGTPLFQLNTISASDVINASQIQKVPYHAIKGYASGGSFGSKLADVGSFAKKLARKAIGAYESLPEGSKQGIANIIKDSATLVSPALGKAIEDFGPAAYDRAKALVGMGYSENQVYDLLVGAGFKKKKSNKVSGGKKLTKAQLQKLAMG